MSTIVISLSLANSFLAIDHVDGRLQSLQVRYVPSFAGLWLLAVQLWAVYRQVTELIHDQTTLHRWALACALLVWQTEVDRWMYDDAVEKEQAP